MDDTIDLSAEVPADTTSYIQDAIDSTGAAAATAQQATDSIQQALGFAQTATHAVSGVLGSFGISMGGVSAPSAKPAITATPLPVQVGSTMQSGSTSTILYILLAVVAVVVLVYALG